MTRLMDHVRHAFVHERWDDLPDAILIATLSSGYTATELAKAMARRAGPNQSYVMTDADTGEQYTWTRERVEARDNPVTGGEA